MTANVGAHRERPECAPSEFAESHRGRDAVARRDTHPGLLGCEVQR
jgi:hypothetical protein